MALKAFKTIGRLNIAKAKVVGKAVKIGAKAAGRKAAHILGGRGYGVSQSQRYDIGKEMKAGRPAPRGWNIIKYFK